MKNPMTPEETSEQRYDAMLLWRAIDRASGDEPCDECGGSGIRVYGNTTTWRGGVGGQTITSDICDKCWGSGNAAKPWLNLRRIKLAYKTSGGKIRAK